MEPLLVFQHRAHSEELLQKVMLSDNIHGIECDIRYKNGLPYLNHDIEQAMAGMPLVSALKYLSGKFIILNIKETGGEIDLINLTLENGAIPLLLDTPFPAVKTIYDQGHGNTIMWRMSEYEEISEKQFTVMKPSWIWLDSFYCYWFNCLNLDAKLPRDCNVCLVSSELQGRDPFSEWEIACNLIRSGNLNAVCTKYPDEYNNRI